MRWNYRLVSALLVLTKYYWYLVCVVFRTCTRFGALSTMYFFNVLADWNGIDCVSRIYS